MGFDQKQFCDFMNQRGFYQYRAMELIKICRRFSVTLEQSPHQLNKLQSVLEACDKALDRVSDPLKKGRKLKRKDETADCEIEKAAKALRVYEYEKKLHAEDKTLIVETEMEAAKKKDEKDWKKDRITAKDGELRVVDFHVFRSLSEKNPTNVKQVLTITSGPPDILWCFSHFRDERCLTLAQKPHFYEGPPAFPTTFGPASQIQPTEDYQGTIHVVPNNEREVFFRLNTQEENRIFESVWRTDDNTLILKDVFGNILGEDIVGQSIPALPLGWSSQELPGSDPSGPKIEGISSPGFTFLRGYRSTLDWRAPIHDLWNSPLTYIHMRIDLDGIFSKPRPISLLPESSPDYLPPRSLSPSPPGSPSRGIFPRDPWLDSPRASPSLIDLYGADAEKRPRTPPSPQHQYRKIEEPEGDVGI